jgi:hypothetical protein
MRWPLFLFLLCSDIITVCLQRLLAQVLFV